VSIQPVIRPRRFAAFPSGHAMEAFLVARLIAELNGPRANDGLDDALQRMATRIANNRVVAGVHFHIDSVAGRMVAESLAEYFLTCCRAGPGSGSGWIHRQFSGDKLEDKDPALQYALRRTEVMQGSGEKSNYFMDNEAAEPKALPTLRSTAVADYPDTPGLLNTLWQQAQAEWQ
jgi:hypothetical protein